jgi:hypothetical protein
MAQPTRNVNESAYSDMSELSMFSADIQFQPDNKPTLKQQAVIRT